MTAGVFTAKVPLHVAIEQPGTSLAALLALAPSPEVFFASDLANMNACHYAARYNRVDLLKGARVGDIMAGKKR